MPRNRSYDAMRRRLEDYFPHRVDVVVPDAGLSGKLNKMHTWCREHAGKAMHTEADKTGDWGHSGYIEPHKSGSG